MTREPYTGRCCIDHPIFRLTLKLHWFGTDLLWFLAIVGITADFSLLAATVWGAREIVRATAARRLERRLSPQDVVELDRAFARVQRDVLPGD